MKSFSRPKYFVINQLAFLAFAIVGSFGGKAYGEELKFVTQEFPPFTYTENGKAEGSATEIVRLICKESKIDCPITITSWGRAQSDVENGLVNGLFVIGWNEERAKVLDFTPPIIQSWYGFFGQTQSKFQYTKPEELSGLKVGVYGPSNTSKSLAVLQEELKKSGKGSFEVDTRPTGEPGFRKVANGRIDLVYSNKDVGMALIKQLPLTNVKYVGNHKSVDYHIGFSKKNIDKKVVDKFKDNLKKLLKDGSIQKILDKWSMTAAAVKE